jgi:hypothetical protein
MMSASDAKAKAKAFLEEKERKERAAAISWIKNTVASKIEGAAEQGLFSVEVYIPGELTVKYIQDCLRNLGYRTEIRTSTIVILWG